MKRKKTIVLALLAVTLMACQQTKEEEMAETSYKPAFEVQDCDLTQRSPGNGPHAWRHSFYQDD